jgi:serine/threonine protein kinase
MMAPNEHARPTDSDFPDLAEVTVIASGAHATVYRAYQISAGREVALKVDDRVLETEAECDRFEAEVRAIGQLAEHPGIIDTYVAGFTDAGRPYVVTELCRGSYADRMAQDGKLPPEEVKRVGIRICDALALAHQNRVLHRDIKPANLLIDRTGHPVLADFGVASLMDSRTEEPVVRAAMTPAYAPLETFNLKPSGEPGDVYSLAATLYAMLSGRPPRFPAGDHAFTIEDVMALFGEPIPDIPGVSRVMVGMLRAAMTNNPAGRPTAVQFRDMLDSVPLAGSTGMIPVVRIPPEPDTAPPPRTPGTPALPLRPESVSPPRTPGVPVPPRGPVAPPPPKLEPVPPPRVVSPPQPRLPDAMGSPSTRDPAGWAVEVDQKPRTRPSPRPSPRPRPAWTTRNPPPGGTRHTGPEAVPAPRESEESDRLPAVIPDRETTTRRERRLAERGGKEAGGIAPLVLVVGIAVSIVMAVAVGLFLFISGDEPPPTQTDEASAESECVLDDFGVSCLEKSLCFKGEQLVDDSDMAAVDKVPCTEKHNWEAYAKGELPKDIDDATYATASKVELVQDTCFDRSEDSPFYRLVGLSATDWSTDVLPPTEKEFDEGGRDFYCVATPDGEETTTKSAFVGS